MEMDKKSELVRLGGKLKELRKIRELSLKEVGNAVNISHNFLSEVENGKKEPSMETLRELAKFFKIDEDEFFRILRKVPLRVQELIEEDIELQKLLSEAQKKFGNNPEKLEIIKEQITRIYKDILDD